MKNCLLYKSNIRVLNLFKRNLISEDIETCKKYINAVISLQSILDKNNKLLILSKENKLHILNLMLNETGLSNLNEQQKKELIDVINEAKNTVIAMGGRYFDRPTIAGLALYTKLSFTTPSRFTQLLNNELNQKMYKEMQDLVQAKTSFNITDDSDYNTVILSSYDLNDSLLQWKQELIEILWKYLYPGSFITAEYDLYQSDFDKFYPNYTQLIKEVFEKLLTEVNILKPANEKMSIIFRKTIFEPLKALLILSNFDDVVESFAGNSVKINAKHRNLIDYIEYDKYKFKKDSYYEASFRDGLAEIDGLHTTTNLLKIAFGQMKLSDGSNLTPLDLRKFIEIVHHVDSDIIEIITNADNEYDALMAILGNDTFKLHYKPALTKAIADFLQKYKLAFDNAIATATDLNEVQEAYRERNVITLLYNAVLSLFPSHVVNVTSDGCKVETTVDRKQPKYNYYNAIRNAAKSNYLTGAGSRLYNAKFEVKSGVTVKTIDDLYSKRVKNYINSILGFILTPEQLERVGADPTILGNCLAMIQKLYFKHLKDGLSDSALETALDDFVEELVQTQAFVVFSDILIEDQSTHVPKIRDLNSNELPGENIYTLSLDFVNSRKKYNKQIATVLGEKPENVLTSIPTLTKQNKTGIFATEGNYISHVLWRGSIVLGKKIVSATDLEPEESMSVAFNYDFIKSLHDKGTMLMQLEGYSDKPRIPIFCYNLESYKDNDGNLVTGFMNTTTEDLNTLKRTLFKQYYRALEKSILSKWNLILNQSFTSILLLIDYLNQNPITYRYIHDLIVKLQNDPETRFNFISEVDYVVDDNGLVDLNDSIVLKIAATHNEKLYEYIDKKNKDHFFEDFAKSSIPNLLKTDEDENDKWDIARLKHILGLTDQTDDVIKQLLAQNTWDRTDPLVNTILERYYAFFSLFRDAELQISMKFPEVHGKNKNARTLSELSSLFGDRPSEELVKEIVEKNLSPRLVTGKKRNNSGVAAATPQKSGRFGVDKEMKIAMVTFPLKTVLNHFGNTEKLNPHDGASFTFGIYSIFEENSYPGHHYQGPKKTIGFFKHLGGITQIKHADYTLTNEVLRSMTHDEKDTTFNPRCVNLAYGLCKLNQRFLYNFAYNGLNISVDPVYGYFNGRLAKLDSFSVTRALADGKYYFNFDWKYTDTQEAVDKQSILNFINKECDANYQVKNDVILENENGIVLNNLMQLYAAFGGMYSMSEDTHGKVDYSEISNIICAQLISWFDVDTNTFSKGKDQPAPPEIEEQSMKSLMLAKICDPESVKSSQIAVNTMQDWKQNNLSYSYLDTSEFGLQQDYTHLSEDSKIPALTQVITAIAFNGNNVNLVNNLYETLGSIIARSIQKYTNLTSNQKELNKYLAIKLLDSVKKNTVASTATDLLVDYLSELLNLGPVEFGFSNKDIFYKITSDLISTLNSDVIKLKFAGIAVIQAPAQGIIMLYEGHDENGNSKWFTRTDLIKQARLKYPRDLIQNYTENLLINEILKEPMFEDILVRMNNRNILNIGDVVTVNGIEVVIEDPNKLFDVFIDIENEENVVKKYNKLRDLATSHITWNDVIDVFGEQHVGASQNLFCIQSTINLKEKEELYAAEPTAENKAKLLKAKRWQRANLEGLNATLKYYYKTESDFDKDIKTNIINFVHKNGLQVMPRVYSDFDEQGYSLSEIKEEGVKFFKKRIEHKFVFNSLKAGEIGILFKDLNVVLTTDEVPQDSKLDVIEEYAFGKNRYWAIDQYGNKLLEVTNKNILVSFVPGEKPIIKVHVPYLEQINTFNSLYNLHKQDVIGVVSNKGFYDKYLSEEENKKFEEDKLRKLNKVANFDSEKLANEMYQSWLLTHQTISARIPSQSFQSFLTTETVAYTENNFNVGYMNIWEMWFLGSDYDIDKAYTMMYALDKKGRIAGNIFTDYTSPETIAQSLNLTIAKYGEIREDENLLQINKTRNLDNILIPIVRKYNLPTTTIERNGEIYPNWAGAIINYIENDHTIAKYQVINEIIEALNNASALTEIEKEEGKTGPQLIYYNSFKGDLIPELVQKLIYYKNEGLESSRNRIMNGIYTQARDLNNLESSEQPMASKKVTDVIKKVLIKYGISEEKIYSEYNPYTIFEILRANAIGKTDVGIAANGVKAAGALQLYFNYIYSNKSGVDLDKTAFNLHIKLDSVEKNGIPVHTICNQQVFRIGNTKISRDKFEYLLRKACGGDVSNNSNWMSKHSDWELFESFINNKVLDANANVHQLDLYATYLSHPGKYTLTEKGFIDFLYDATKDEDNVADIISIFISLATDNAKELALAKIYGTPDLLSIPLAMITLGIDIETTIETCINLLEPIHDELTKNRFKNNKYVDVRQVIINLGKGDTADNKGLFTEDTVKSLLAIYDFALELRSITAFFKVNQGVETKYSDLKLFLNGLASDRIKKAQNRGNSSKAKLMKQIDYSLLFAQNQDAIKYLEQIKNEYDISKVVVNVMDVVLTSPHFRGLLKSSVDIMNLLENHISVKAKILDLLTGVSDPEVNVDMSDLKTQAEKLYAYAKILRVVDAYAIEKFLQSNSELLFSIDQLNSSFDNSSLLHFGRNQYITLSTPFGVNTFVDFVNKTFIPKLKEDFQYNTFVEHLTIHLKNNGKKDSYYDIDIDPYSLKDNPAMANMFNIIRDEFELISNMESGIRSASGKMLTIGEVMYIYSIITGRGLTTGLFTVSENSALNGHVIETSMKKVYADLDKFVQTPSKESSDNLRLICKFLKPYATAAIKTGDSIQMNIDGRSVNLDITKEWVLTMNKLRTSVNKTEAELSRYISELRPGVEVKTTIGRNGEKETYNFTITVTNILNPSQKITFTKEFQTTYVENANLVDMTYIASVRDAIDNALLRLLNSNPILYDYEHINTQVDIKSYIKLLEDDSKNNPIMVPIVDGVQNLMEKCKFIIKNKEHINTYYQQIGDDRYVYVNTIDIKRNTVNRILDLYYTSIGCYSETEKMVAVLQTLFPNSYVDRYNFKEFIPKLSDNIDPILKNYINYIRDNLDKEELKLQGKKTLLQYSIPLTHPSYYYIKTNEEEVRTVGDIYHLKTDKNELNLYIYAGISSNGFPLFVPTKTGKNSQVIIQDPDQLLIHQKLIADPTHIIGLTPNIATSEIKQENFNPETLRVGDLIKFWEDGNFYTITDILPIKTKTGFNYRIVLKNLGNLFIMSGNNDKYLLKINEYNYPLSLTKESNIYIKRAEISKILTVNSNQLMINENEFDSQIKNEILNNLKGKDKVIRVIDINNEVYTVSKIYPTYITTSTGVVSLDDIKSIILDEDVEYNIKEASVHYIEVPNSTKKGQELWYTVREWTPELADGYINSPSKNELTNTYTPVETIISDKDTAKIPKVTIDDSYIKVEKQEPKVGDIYVKKYIDQNQKGRVLIYKIIGYNPDPDKNEIAVLSKSFYLENDETRIGNTDPIIITKDFLQDYTHYSKQQDPVVQLNNLRDLNSKGRKFLEVIKNKTGLNVQIVNDSTLNFNAKVDYRTNSIIINVAKKPENMSNNEYIASLAAHEYSHVLLAMLRVQSPTVYAGLILYITKNFNLSAMNKDYNTIEKAEEYIVLTLEEEFRKGYNESTSLMNLITDVFIKYVAETGKSASKSSLRGSLILSRTVGSFMTQENNIAGSIPDYLDPNMIKNQRIRDEILNEIINSYACDGKM